MKFYKYKIGNSSFDYDVMKKLDKILEQQERKKDSLICGIFSAIISNYIIFFLDIDGFKNNRFLFIVCLFAIYALLFAVFYYGKKLVKYIIKYVTRNNVSCIEEEELQRIFFNKIVNIVIMGVSLVNRIEILKCNNQKQELWYIYAIQARYCFQQVSDYLESTVFRKSKTKIHAYIKSLGEGTMKWVLETSYTYLGKVHCIINEIDVETAQNYYNRKLIDYFNIDLKQAGLGS